jgi:quercetin dioxygenase-like cupin family protein
MEVAVPRDAGPPPHLHPWDEAYYVIEGEVAFSIGGREQKVTSGDFIYAPGGTVHAFKGTSEQPARMLIFDAPAHAESFFREVDQEVKGPADMAKVPEIGSKHQIEFLRP